MKNIVKLFTLLAGLAFVFAGCAKPVARCTDPEDNPQHHYLSGMDLLEKNKADAARMKFDRALYCEEKFGPAHAGLAIIDAMKAAGEKAAGYRQVDVDSSFSHLKQAGKLASSAEDEFATHVAYIRVYTLLQTKKWLSEAEGDYRDAMKLKVDERKLLYYDGKESAGYFMGLAYLAGREFQQARDRFSDVLNSKREGKWHGPADKAWKKVDKIVRALAGLTVGDVGKEIAVKESINKGDLAALLVDEMKITKLFEGRIPVKSEIDKMKADFTPADVLNSPYKEEALAMMKWNVRGLEPVFDQTTKAYLFKPEEPVTRKEFALTIEDILIKLTGDEKIASAFFGHEKSPFPDVPPTAAWYNAVMNATTRSIMETELSGEFRANDPVDGAEALLAIRVLRQRLNIY